MTTYKITRYFQFGGPELLQTGVTQEEAKEHCNDPESSSRTATSPVAAELTAKRGPWFDGWREEE